MYEHDEYCEPFGGFVDCLACGDMTDARDVDSNCICGTCRHDMEEELALIEARATEQEREEQLAEVA